MFGNRILNTVSRVRNCIDSYLRPEFVGLKIKIEFAKETKIKNFEIKTSKIQQIANDKPNTKRNFIPKTILLS